MRSVNIWLKKNPCWLTRSRHLLLGIVLGGSLAGCHSSTAQPTVAPVYKAATIGQLRVHYQQILAVQGVKVLTMGQDKTLVIPSDRLFAPRSANILPGESALLATVVQWMNTYSTVSVQVAAYSDPAENPAIAQLITEKQAQQVVDSLGRSGLNTRLLYAKGYGVQNPVAMVSLPNSGYFNRRVEIHFRVYTGSDQ